MFIPGNIIPLGTAEVPSFHYLSANGCYHSVPLQSLRIRLVHCSNWRPHGICIEHVLVPASARPRAGLRRSNTHSTIRGTATSDGAMRGPAQPQATPFALPVYWWRCSAALSLSGDGERGKPLPDGSLLFADVYAAKLDAGNRPMAGADGFYVPEKLPQYTAMASGEDWGKDIPDMLRNADWNYAIFSADKQLQPGVNQAVCLACPKPLDNVSYTVTVKQLAEAK